MTNHDECVVSLTYYDSDNDMVSIGSKEELMDAIEQFSDATPPVLRITSYVNPSSPSTTTSGGFAAAAAAAAATATPTTTTGSSQSPSGPDRRTDRGTSTRGDVPAPVPAPLVVHGVPVQKVLESFVGVLSTAVNHLQEGLTTTNPPHQGIGGSRKVTTGDVPDSDPATTETSGGSPDVDAGRTAAFKTEATSTVEPSSEAEIELTAAADGDGKKEDTKKEAVMAAPGTSNESPSKTTGVETQGSRLFIHGRHTCDSCLSTPIIGKRYHSINLPDYDLCENCRNNYKGSDIQFEPVELDRDRPFQERWHRRHSRNLSLRMMRASTRHSRFSAGGRNRNGPRGFATRSESSGIPARGGRECRRHPMTVGLRRHQFAAKLKPAPEISGLASSKPPVELASDVKTPVPLAPPANRAESEFDVALKEAIRRSLNDIAPKEAAITSESKKAADEDNASENVHTDNTSDLQLKEDLPDAVEETRPEKDGEDEGEPSPATTSRSGIPRSVEVRKSEMSKLSYIHESPAYQGFSGPIKLGGIVDAETVPSSSPTEARWSTEIDKLRALGFDDGAVASVLNNAMEKVTDTSSVDSEKLADEEDASGKVSKHQSNDQGSTLSSRSLKIDQSFSSDAVGNGDVAEAIGATLDMVVGQITEMLDEQADVKTGVSEVSNPGEIIVNPDHPATDGDRNETDGDWSVVKSVVSEGSNGTTEEEQIARAASMLGSALFNSDMKNSVENVSSKISAPGDARSVSSFSVPSSVPTDVGTNNSVSPSQLARWSTELEKLCALGFEEEKCVEILERLSAANIGVDSEDEEISLELVVNKLLEERLNK